MSVTLFTEKRTFQSEEKWSISDAADLADDLSNHAKGGFVLLVSGRGEGNNLAAEIHQLPGNNRFVVLHSRPTVGRFFLLRQWRQSDRVEQLEVICYHACRILPGFLPSLHSCLLWL